MDHSVHGSPCLGVLLWIVALCEQYAAHVILGLQRRIDVYRGELGRVRKPPAWDLNPKGSPRRTQPQE
jgi:hypothetical protein